MRDLTPGKSYKCTCFKGDVCTYIETKEVIGDEALVMVQYRGRLYLVADFNLY